MTFILFFNPHPLYRRRCVTPRFVSLVKLTGILEIAKIEEQNPAMQVANQHMAVTIIAWCFYVTSLYLRYDELTLVSRAFFFYKKSAGHILKE